jgi:hypothetical protein
MPAQPRQRRFASLVAVLVLIAAPSAKAQGSGSDATRATVESVAQSADPSDAEAFEAAREAYEHCHWALAFGQLVRLAERGHAAAARQAMQMHRSAPALYGELFPLSEQQLERFARVRMRAQNAVARPAGS